MKTLLPSSALLSLLLLAGCGGVKPNPCTTDADCGQGSRCEEATCVAGPDTPTSCAAGETRPCGNPAVGACKQGTQRCVNGAFEAACAGEVKPASESCNGVDDDCDGQIDEGVTTDYYPDRDGDGYGSATASPEPGCAPPAGYAANHDDCDDRPGAGAAIHPGAQEVCDAQGVDEDCDGQANPGCGCATPGMSQPCCAGRGLQTCTAQPGGGATFSACSVQPTPEVCNGVDDDCDGQTDEGVVVSSADGGTVSLSDGGVGAADGTCAVGVGACARSGATTCTASLLVCSAAPGAPEAERCNGLDDDCDGQTDEELGTLSCGVGECARTVNACAGGTQQSCTPGAPTAERCNNLDDDCNGQVDDGLGTTSCGVGACARSVPACVSGQVQTCTPGAPGTESCNGVDDDCDGQTDEGLGQLSCGVGVCARTVAACANGSPQVCAPGAPGTETCNGLDDDCDGQVDEGQLFTCYADPDGDLRATNTTPVLLCPDLSRGAAGFCPVGYVAPNSLGIDCAPNNAALYQFASTRADADNDYSCTGLSLVECIGASPAPGRRLENTCGGTDDCNDANPSVYRLMASRTDADGDTYCTGPVSQDCVGSTALPGRRFQGACFTPDDCDDANGSVFRVETVRFDSDNDGYCAGTPVAMCIGNAPPAGRRIITSCQGEDCKDTNAAATTQCTLSGAYTTTYRTQSCPSGTTTSLVTPINLCPPGFVLGPYAAQKSSGGGNCTAASPTSVTQSCNFLEGSTCRVVGDCWAQ